MMRKRIGRGGALTVCLLLPLTGCLEWLEVHDYVDERSESGRSPTGSAPMTALCGADSFAAVVELACTQERGLCERWAQCAGIFTPLEDCVAEREAKCQQRVQFALQAGSCFLPRASAANAENGCYDSWQQTQGACVVPVMEELTVALAPCEDEWSPGAIPEGGACLYGASGCAAPDAPQLYASCAFESSFEPGGGACRWLPDLPRGATCERGASDYCNGSDACLSSGICDQRRALGDGCELDNDCASLLCAAGICTDPEGFSCVERSCPVLWSCEEQVCTRRQRT
jgi:hypothetical protein